MVDVLSGMFGIRIEFLINFFQVEKLVPPFSLLS